MARKNPPPTTIHVRIEAATAPELFARALVDAVAAAAATEARELFADVKVTEEVPPTSGK